MSPLKSTFVAGNLGRWRIDRIDARIGDALPPAQRLDILETHEPSRELASSWTLRGMTSNTRYATRRELEALAARQETLNRTTATRAALIPIKKSEAWWNLAQDERRRVLETRSHHIDIGLQYLPAIARRLHHSRDLAEPFDFLTWFEFAPEHSDAFDELLRRLRTSQEWRYVEREIDIRLSLE